MAVLELVKDITKAIRAEEFDTPNLVCFLVAWEFEQTLGLSRQEQLRESWTTKLQQGTRKKGWFTKEMRLFFVCARTYKIVPCGPNGHGYRIKEVREWVKKAFGVVKAMVQLTSIALGPLTAAGVASDLIEAFGEVQDKIPTEDLQKLRTNFEAMINDEKYSGVEELRKTSAYGNVSFDWSHEKVQVMMT